MSERDINYTAESEKEETPFTNLADRSGEYDALELKRMKFETEVMIHNSAMLDVIRTMHPVYLELKMNLPTNLPAENKHFKEANKLVEKAKKKLMAAIDALKIVGVRETETTTEE